MFRKNLDLFFTNGSSVMFTILLDVSISLNLHSNSLMLFYVCYIAFRARENFAPNFNKLISPFVCAYVDRFIILGFVLSILVFLFRLEFLNNDDCFLPHIPGFLRGNHSLRDSFLIHVWKFLIVKLVLLFLHGSI